MTFGQTINFRSVQGALNTGTYLDTHRMTGELRIQVGTHQVWIQASWVVA